MTGRAGRPVQLLEPAPDPEPVAGCDVCGALARQRAGAYAVGDRSKATDCNVEIRRHPHPEQHQLRTPVRRAGHGKTGTHEGDGA